MKNGLLIAMVMSSPVFALGLSGCLGDGGGDSSDGKASRVNLKDPSTVALTQVTSPKQGAQAAAASRDAAGSGGDFGQDQSFGTGLFRINPAVVTRGASLDRETASAMRLASKGTAAARRVVDSRGLAQRLRGASTFAPKAVVTPCPLGGSVSEDAVMSGDSYTVTVVYTNCDDGSATRYHEVTNGTVKMAGTQTSAGGNGSLVFGDGDGDLESGDFTVTTYDGTIQSSASVLSLTETFSWTGDIDAAGEVVLQFSIAGRTRMDSTALVETISFDDFAITLNADNNPSDMIQSSLTFNGAVEDSVDQKSTTTAPDTSAYLGFVNFTYSYEMGMASGGSSLNINGKAVVEHTPASCGDGSYQVVTSTPFQWNSAGTLIAGNMTINDNVTIHANGDGTVTVTVNGVSQSFKSFDEMESSVCL